MKRVSIVVLGLAVIATAPSVALANVVTPVIWASVFHLLVGNAFIGLLEGGLLAYCFQVRPVRGIALMILANYVSVWLGWLFLLSRIQDHFQPQLDNFWGLMWGMMGVAYLLTLSLEWPFVAWAVAGRPHWFARSCRASLLIQTTSYVLLCGWYGMVSVTSLYTEAFIVPLDEITIPEGILVYYIADDDGDVYVRDLKSGQTEKVFDLNSRDGHDRLSHTFVRQVSYDSPSQASEQFPSARDRIQLVAILESKDRNGPTEINLGVALLAESLAICGTDASPPPDRRDLPGYTPTSRLGSGCDSPWNFETGYWPRGGLSGVNAKTGETIWLALETPFAGWSVRRATLLPADVVLFQLGERQICVLDVVTRRVALLTFGRSPLAVLKPAL